MENFILHAQGLNKKILRPTSYIITEEGLKHSYELYLTKELWKQKTYGNFRSVYRLHACVPHTVEMALAYNILCPKCGKPMRQIGRCQDFHTLGLYECMNCDKD